eukprot:scaffold13064_cov28-Phaeocystis_antarctica.AAC.2
MSRDHSGSNLLRRPHLYPHPDPNHLALIGSSLPSAAAEHVQKTSSASASTARSSARRSARESGLVRVGVRARAR